LDRCDEIKHPQVVVEGSDRVGAARGELDSLVVCAKPANTAHLSYLPQMRDEYGVAEVNVLFGDAMTRDRREGGGRPAESFSSLGR
jgi:hypothetical protein